MMGFVYEALPERVVFGHGTFRQLPDEVARLGLERALVLATPQQAQEAERIAATLGGRSVGTFAGAVMHTPVEVTAQAM
jgi:maleylacetate reductase